MERIRIGLIGAGTVGSGVIEILKKESTSYREKFGIELVLFSVCTRTPEKSKRNSKIFQIVNWNPIIKRLLPILKSI